MQRLCALGDIPDGGGREVVADRRGAPLYLALFRVDGAVYAYLNTCPHQGRSLNLAADEFALLGDGRVMCPHHGACFEIRTGLCTEGPCRGASLTPVAVRVVDDMVLLAGTPA